MHAYLIVGENISQQSAINDLAKRLNSKILEFPIAKIEDVRNLNDLIKLSFSEPTLVVCRDIHKTGDEALNAFLKNLEEPQKNIYFALTANSTKKVLATIVSRCQIVRTIGNKSHIDSESEMAEFFKMGIGEKFSYIDKIKDRGVALEFAENMVNFMHGSLHENGLKYKFSIDDFATVLKTISGLNANGNVNLQLSNMVIKLTNNGK